MFMSFGKLRYNSIMIINTANGVKTPFLCRADITFVIVAYPCKHPSSNGRSMDVRVLCSMDVPKYVLVSSFMDVQQ